MPNILLICTANQIRSPLAQAFLTKILTERGLEEDYTVTSAGTWAVDDQPALSKAIAVGRDFDVDLSQHKSRGVRRDLLEEADLVLTMETYQKEALRYEFPQSKEKVYRLTELVGDPEDIRDPVSGDLHVYQVTAERIYQTLEAGLDEILRLAR